MRYYTDSDGNTQVLSGGLAGVGDLGVTFFQRATERPSWPSPDKQMPPALTPTNPNVYTLPGTPRTPPPLPGTDNTPEARTAKAFIEYAVILVAAAPDGRGLPDATRQRLKSLYESIKNNLLAKRYPAISLADLLWITSIPPVFTSQRTHRDDQTDGRRFWGAPEPWGIDPFFPALFGVLEPPHAWLATHPVVKAVDAMKARVAGRLSNRQPPPWFTGTDAREAWSLLVETPPQAPVFNRGWQWQTVPRTTLFSRR